MSSLSMFVEAVQPGVVDSENWLVQLMLLTLNMKRLQNVLEKWS